jgi:hypothetical protein
MYALCGSALLWSVQPLPLLSLNPLPPSPCFSTIFNANPYILYCHILLCDITDALSFFPFSLSLSSIE